MQSMVDCVKAQVIWRFVEPRGTFSPLLFLSIENKTSFILLKQEKILDK